MKTIYFECKMGAAGDMLGAALLSLFDDPLAVVEELNAIGIKDVTYVLEDSIKCGITGKHLRVMVNGVEELPEEVRSNIGLSCNGCLYGRQQAVL